MQRLFTVKSCCQGILGSAILAFGLYHIHSVSAVTEGGQLGLVLLLDHWFHISPALSSLVLNILCYALGFGTLGLPFLARSGLCAASFSLTYFLCQQFPPFFPGIAQLPLLASILGALFVGVGTGLCVRSGGAPSGDDALAMAISRKSKLKIEYVYLISDLTVLLLSLSYIPWQRILYSLLTVTLSSLLVGLIDRFPKQKEGTPHEPQGA